jgi:hypothetical protein
MADRHGRLAEILVALLVAAFAGAILYGGRQLAANPFEPIGSRTIPAIASWIAIVLAAVVLAQAAWALRRGALEVAAGEQWGAVALTFLATVGYAALLSTGLVRYRWVTMAFIPLVVLAVADDRRRALPWALALGVAYGLGLDAIFRHVLVTDIP